MFCSYESSSNYNRKYGRFNSELRGMACRNHESALRGSREFWRDNSLEKEETVNKKQLKYIGIISAILGFLNMIFVVSLLFIPLINQIELGIIFFYFLFDFFYFILNKQNI